MEVGGTSSTKAREYQYYLIRFSTSQNEVAAESKNMFFAKSVFSARFLYENVTGLLEFVGKCDFKSFLWCGICGI